VTPDNRPEYQQLLSALCDGQLTDAEWARLEQWLATSPECRRLYLEYVDVHARLSQRHNSASSVEAPAPPQPARPVARFRRSRLLTHAAVAAASIAATVLVQFAWLRGPDGRGDSARRAGDEKVTGYVATLTRASGCVWDRPGESFRAGARLLPGEVRLVRGLAQIHFDSGADLVVEGPATLRLATGRSATVVQGKVVFRADETTAPFDLHTPTSSLVDFGTEYAVLVSREGEEVHVFEGEVERTPSPGAGRQPAQHLKAGEARRYEPAADSAGQPTPLDAPKFVRRAPEPGKPLADLAAGLLAYEGFDYRGAEFLAGQANGGIGWDGPWVFAFARPADATNPDDRTPNFRIGLTRPAAAVPPVGGSFDFRGFTKAFRRLETPVRLDTDGVYYLSYLFRHHGPPADPTNAVAVLFWPDEDAHRQDGDPRRRLNVGVGGANQLFTHLGGVGSRTPLPLTYGETYLLVAKVVASAADPDQVFIRVYAPHEPVEREEPGSWSVVGPAFDSDLTFPWLQLHVNSQRQQTIDEIRLGTTWASVTAPWIVAAEVGK
jgi:ferric-dicitrate binding protein FerR (iron transport regulator)